MAKFKATKAAFVGSFISLLLSCAMLLGTTYAWLTDSVSSSDNRISSGSLDIDLLIYKSGKYVSIADGGRDIFSETNGGKTVDWEPDKTEIIYLAVENIGSLALEYNIKLNVTGNLAGALEYAILDNEKADEPTVVSWLAIKNNKKALNGKLNEATIPVVKGELNKEKSINYFAIAVHMPDNASDKYQDETIAGSLNLSAKQSSYEKDSYGNTYDKGPEGTYNASKMTVVTIDTLRDFKRFTKAVNTDGTYENVKVANNPSVYVKLMDNIDLSKYTKFAGIGDGEENSFDGVFDGGDHTIENWTAENTETTLALFRTTNGAEIKNLTIDKFTLGFETTKGSDYGVLVGSINGGNVLINKVTVKNSTLAGQKTIGVIVGKMNEGHLKITNCNVQHITIRNAEGYIDVVGVLLGNGYSENDLDKRSFEESENVINNIKWFNADTEQINVPAYNYEK